MYGRIFKRVFDILLSGIALALLAPFFLLIVLVIRLEDGSGALFIHERVGQNGRRFRLLKFRSMPINTDNKPSAVAHNLKITRTGRFIRRTNIDELPQLWSVLKGDLSIVGPRPEFPALSREYSSRIPYYNARYLVTPGLTGWAQLKHDQHPHHMTDIAETKRKLSYDLYYLKHRSLFLDIFIILQTVKVVLTARGS